jgi:hypothetical protein
MRPQRGGRARVQARPILLGDQRTERSKTI